MEMKGETRVADDVVLTITGIAATEIQGVKSLAGGLTHNLITSSDVDSIHKCIRMSVDEKKISLQVAIVVDGTKSIPEVSCNVKKSVKENVEQMVGMEVANVDVLISGVES